MTRDQVVDMVLQRLVRRAGDTDMTAAIVAELNLAQATICERGPIKPWFMLQTATLTIDGTGWRAPLPADFIDLIEEAPAVLSMSAATSGGYALERVGRAELEWSAAPVNTVSAYDVMEGYLLLAKQLTVASLLRILYYRSQALPTGDYGSAGQPAPNKWYVYAPDVMVAEAAINIAGTKLRDDKIVAMLDKMRQNAWNRLLAETVAKTESAVERFLSGAVHPVIGAPRTVTNLA